MRGVEELKLSSEGQPNEKYRKNIPSLLCCSFYWAAVTAQTEAGDGPTSYINISTSLLGFYH